MATFVKEENGHTAVESPNPAAAAGAGEAKLEPDGYPSDLEIPIRYIKGMGGDMVEARRRWIESLKWHESYGVNNILQEPQPHFDVIKKYYPHFVYNRAKNGFLTYYELPAGIDLAKLRANGVSVDDLLRHYVYITEFMWNVLDTNEESKLLTVWDLAGVKLSMFVGEAKEFMVKSAKVIAAHYPERSFKIFVVNAPWWFNLVWKLLSPLLHPNTKAKVIVKGSKYMEELEGLIDLDQIPSAIGGKDSTPVLDSKEEIAVREHVMKVLAENGMEMTPEV